MGLAIFMASEVWSVDEDSFRKLVQRRSIHVKSLLPCDRTNITKSNLHGDGYCTFSLPSDVFPGPTSEIKIREKKDGLIESKANLRTSALPV